MSAIVFGAGAALFVALGVQGHKAEAYAGAFGCFVMATALAALAATAALHP